MRYVISLQVPSDDPKAHKAAAAFFNTLVGNSQPLCEDFEVSGSQTGRFKASAPEPKAEAPAPQPEPAPTPTPEQTAPAEQEAPQEVAEADEYPVEVNGQLLDADGVPHDHRIHSSNKKVYQSGSDKGRWQRKRGGDKDEYERVTAELKQAMANAGGQPVAQAPEPKAEQEAPQPTYNAGSAFGGNPAPAAEAPQGGQLTTPQQFWQAIAQGGYSPQAVEQVCKAHNWSSIAIATVEAPQQGPGFFDAVIAELEAAKAGGQ
jgi:hypothetical protein